MKTMNYTKDKLYSLNDYYVTEFSKKHGIDKAELSDFVLEVVNKEFEVLDESYLYEDEDEMTSIAQLKKKAENILSDIRSSIEDLDGYVDDFKYEIDKKWTRYE